MTTTPDAAKATTTLWRLELSDGTYPVDVEVEDDGCFVIEQRNNTDDSPSRVIIPHAHAFQLCHNIMAAAELAQEQDTE